MKLINNIMTLTLVLAYSFSSYATGTDDWCKGIEPRIKNINKIKEEQTLGFKNLKKNSTVTYNVKETDSDGIVSEYSEKWRVLSIDPLSYMIQLEIQKEAKGKKNTEVTNYHYKIVNLGKYDPKNKESCSHPYIYAHDFKEKKSTIGIKKLNTLWRSQLNLGSAAYEEELSHDVPFLKVYSKLDIKQASGKFNTKEMKVVSYSY